MRIIYHGCVYESILPEEDEDDIDEEEEYTYDPDEDDAHPIQRLEQDDQHEYQRIDGITYRLGYNNNDFTVSVDQIEATPENTFYEDQIEKYERYIRDGGIIDTFPVRVSALAYTLEQMLDFFDAGFRGPYEDDIDSAIHGTILQPLLFDLYELYSEIGEDEKYYKYNRINKNARSLEEVFPQENRTQDEVELLKALDNVFDFFDEHKDYTLNEMNHRFQAVKRLGVKTVLVEPL